MKVYKAYKLYLENYNLKDLQTVILKNDMTFFNMILDLIQNQ